MRNKICSFFEFHLSKGKTKKVLSGAAIWILVLSFLIPAFYLNPAPAQAAVTVDVNAFGLSNGNFPGAPIKASSSAVAITKVKINPTATATLTSVAVQFSGADFATTTLAAIADNANSGVSLYNDAGTTADSFDGSDGRVALASPDWTVDTANITLTPTSAPSLTASQNNIFYIVIRTSSTAAEGARIAATIPANGAVTSAGNGPATAQLVNDFRVDATAPTITSAVGYVGQTAITVSFSEPVQATGGGNLTYTEPGSPFTIASSTIAAISHTAGSNVATLTMNPALATGDFGDGSPNTIRASSTASTIVDMAGNNMTAGAVNFTSPLTISTSAIPSTYVGAVYGADNTLVTFASSGGSGTIGWSAATTTDAALLSDIGLSLAYTTGKLTGTVANKTGSYLFNVEAGNGTASTTKAFNINIAATNVGGVPGISSVSPPGAAVGASNATVTITGSNTNFTSASQVQFLLPFGVFGSNGIATSTVAAASATSLTVVVSVDAGAVQGNRDLQITTGTQVVLLPNAFSIGPAIGAGLNLQFPSDGATGVQVPPAFNFTPSASGSLNAYRITVKTTSDFSGPAAWDYAFPKPDASFSNGSHCGATSCNLNYGAGTFRIITQPAALSPGATYYWNVRTYSVSTDLLTATDSQVPLETTASRSLTISNSITDTSPPTISHRPVFQATASIDANLYARVLDNLANASTTPALSTNIFYCAGAGCDPTTQTSGTSTGAGYYNFTIPGATVGGAGTIIRYYLQANDGTNTSYASQGSSATSTPAYQITSAAAGSSTSISGTVKDSANNNLANALVFAEGSAFVAATTASDGTFTLGSNNLLAGTYDLVAYKDGYSDRFMTGIPTGTTGLNFSLPSGGGGGFGGDSTRPRVRFHGPMDGMTGISGNDSNFKIFVVFDKTMSQSSVATSTTMTVREVNPATGATTDITTSKGAWTYYTSAPPAGSNLPSEANMAAWSFTGSNNFGDGKTIAVVVTASVTDTAGNQIQGNQPDGSYVFSFSTGSTASFSGNTLQGGTFGTGAFVPPRVSGTTPPPGTTDVPRNTKIVVNFTDPMADDGGGYLLKTYVKLFTVSGTTETDVSTSAIDTVTLSSDKLNATVSLLSTYNSGTFAASASYRVKILGGAKAANNMFLAPPGQESNVMFSADFKTGASTDTVAPTVVGFYPSNGAAGIPVNVGAVNAGFSKDINSSTITSSTFSLSVGSTAVNGSVEYQPLERQAYFIPKSALTPNTKYTLTVSSSIQGLNSQALTATSTVFTTGAGDTTQPKVSFSNSDDYNIAITFSEPMNSAKATDSLNWPTSVLNPTVYDVIKYGAAGFATSTAGTAVSLTGATFAYDAISNTVNIKGVSLSPAVGQELYVSFDTTGANSPKDLSGNAIDTGVSTARGPVKSSASTNGMLGPGAISGDMFSSGGGFMPTNFSSSTFGFAPPIEVRPFNTMAGQTTVYGVRLPISTQIPNGGTVVLTFPTGFDVTNAQQDVNSPMRRDLNGPGTGAVTFKCQTNSTAVNGKSCGGGAANSDDTGGAQGGLADDGVVVDATARTVTVYISGATNSEGHDFLTIDISGVKNSTVPKDFNTAGYTVDVKTKNGSTILESLTSGPFFIQAAGAYTLSGTITATNNDQSDTLKIYLMSPMTGPLEATSAGFAGTASAAYSFTNLPAGDYWLFTDQTIILDGVEASSKEFTGKTIPERIVINETTDLSSDSADNDVIDYDFTLGSNTSGGTDVTISIDGPSAELLDIFAGSPTGFKVRQVTLDSNAGAENFTINLADGSWFVGVGPQMPKGFSMSGPPPAPSYLPPKPVNLKVASPICTQEGGTNGCSLTFTLTSSNRAIRGLVKDGAGKVITDAEVFAYSPVDGFGTHSQSDSTGAFTLNVVDGTFKVGAFVPGMPSSKEVPVVVNSDATKGGHANNYLFIDGAATGIASTTAATSFILRLAKPDYTISGKVTDGTNVVQGASVYAYRSDGPGGANAITDSSGNYTIYVTSGAWRVGVFLPQYGQLTEQSVTVTTASQSNINFAPSGTGTFYTVSGNVKVGGVNRQGAFVRLSGNSTFNEAITDSSGNYSFKVPGGNGYVVRAFIPGIGETAPLASFNVSADVTGKDISVGAANTITFNISPDTTAVSKALFDLFSATGVGGHTEMTNATSTTMSLPNGSYKVSVNVPGVVIGLTDISAAGGAYANTTGILTVDGAETVTITLPTRRAVSGTVKDSSANNISDAWVEITLPANGVHLGVKSGSDGTFSLSVADSSSSYYINAVKPGYFRDPSALTVNGSDATGQILTIASASLAISGQVLIGSSGAANAFIRADKLGGGFAGTQADANGNYSLPVKAGSWKVHAVADGYREEALNEIVVIDSTSATGKNINLLTRVSLNSPISKSIVPASGGTLEDAAAGFKLIIPPNALGSSTSAATVQAKETNNLTPTGSAKPLNSKARKITATDSSGSPINTLNSSITMEMTYTKAELAAAASGSDTSIDTIAEVIGLSSSYWDESTGSWMTLATNVIFKDSSGNVIIDTTTIDTASEFSANVATVVIAATMDHLSDFASSVTSNPSSPATPTRFTATAASNTQINLSWTAVSGATSYDIYRGTSADGSFPRLGSEPTISSGSTVTYSDTGLTGVTTYYYKITALNGSGESDVSSAVSAATTPGGAVILPGGGGGSSQTPAASPQTTPSATPSKTTPTTTTTPSTPTADTNLAQVKSDAAAIASSKKEQILALVSKIADSAKEKEFDKSIVSKVVSGVKAVNAEARDKILTFVTYGTPSTNYLGAGERGGVVNSFKEAFGKLPQTQADWQDVVKIANGRWPSQTSKTKEDRATLSFKSIYKRASVRTNPHDDAAVVVMAYGLRPRQRNLDSEKAAIKSYRAVFGRSPVTATAWDAVRAIAYSGAKR